MQRPGPIARALAGAVLATIAASAWATQGTTTDSSWLGTNDSDFSNPYNWSGGVVPPIDGSTVLVFSSNTNYNGVTLPYSVAVAGLSVSGTGAYPWIGVSTGTPTLTIGANGITLPSTGSAGLSIYPSSLTIAADQTWNTGLGGFISTGVPISGTGNLTLAGSGTVYFSGSSTSGYSGSITVSGGTLSLGSGNAIGGTTLVMGENTTLQLPAFSVTLANPIELHNNVSLWTSNNGNNARQIATLTGNLSLAGSAVAGQPYNLTTSIGTYTALESTGNLSGVSGASGTNLTVTGGGLLLLGGTTGAEIQGITATGQTAVVFSTASALPSTTSLSANSGGAIGVAGTNALLASVLAQITNPSTFAGTLSLDSDFRSTSTPNSYSANFDFSQFTAPGFSIGSLTSATIASDSTLIPPSGGNFQFGNGGGRLVVQANLNDPSGATTGSTGLVLSSTGRPLTLVLQDSNAFTGNVSVDSSFLILDSNQALPSTAKIHLGYSGYAGFTPNWNGAPPADFIARIDSTSYDATSVIGFDSAAPASQAVVVNGNIDLHSLPSALYLGTTTHGASIPSSVVITPTADGVLKFAALQGGSFIIDANLANTNGVSKVVFGHTNTSLVGTAYGGNVGNYELGGTNTYASGTMIYNGDFTLASSSPFGSGDITIDSGAGEVDFNPKVAVTLSQNIAANNTKLVLGDTSLSSASAAPLVIAGALTGSASITVGGKVSFQGANTYYGSTTINDGAALFVQTNGGLGTGSVTLGNGTGAGTAELVFGSAALAPVLGSLGGEGTLVVPQTAATLTINQNYSSVFTGVIEALNSDSMPVSSSARLIINNSTYAKAASVDTPPRQLTSAYTQPDGSLTLAGSSANLYSGGTSVNLGTLRVQNTSASPLGDASGNLELNGATLSMEQTITGSAVVVPNPIAPSSTSISTIQGRGTLLAPGGLTVDSHLVLSPGFSTSDYSTESLVYLNYDHSSGKNLGSLTFGSLTSPTSLTFAGGGSLDIHIEDPNLAAGVGFGTLNVLGKIDFTATSAQPFTIRLLSGGKGGYNPTDGTGVSLYTPYSLVIASASQGITHFDPTALTYDLSQLNIPPTFTISDWSFSLDPTQTELLLNFTPVPEPGTWALMLTGAGLLGAPLLWRRLRRRPARP